MKNFSSCNQTRLPLGSPPECRPLEVLDLFAGIGGMSLGFRQEGFRIIAVDHEPLARAVHEINAIGSFVEQDLAADLVLRDVPVVIGGPPCRPWSAVNVRRRGRQHDDHLLLERFFRHLIYIRPAIFIMENVPPLIGDPDYQALVRDMEYRGYSVQARVLRYSDFGTASARRRLFTVGVRDSVRSSATAFFERLEEEKRPPRTVRQEIEWLRETAYGGFDDHHWSRLTTIPRYAEKYRTGEFGWRQLTWDAPAPSFGSIAKTYILHPSAGEGGFPERVLSVRELLCIMGFSRSFRFPPRAPLSKRYHMVANAVSPVVAAACARVVKETLRT